jgi:hypothetical protein
MFNVRLSLPRLRTLLVITCAAATCASAPTASSEKQEVFSQKQIRAIMKKVCDWQIAHPVEINKENHNLWARAAFYTGVMAAYHSTNKKVQPTESVHPDF